MRIFRYFSFLPAGCFAFPTQVLQYFHISTFACFLASDELLWYATHVFVMRHNPYFTWMWWFSHYFAYVVCWFCKIAQTFQAFFLRYIQRAVLFLTVMYQHGSVVSEGLLYVFPQGTLLSKDLRGFVVSYRASMLICIAMILYSRYEFLSKAHK